MKYGSFDAKKQIFTHHGKSLLIGLGTVSMGLFIIYETINQRHRN